MLKGKLVEETTPVGAFEIANNFGLYDMHGNVYEWCLDCWHDDSDGGASEDNASLSQDETQERVIRGGFWRDYPKHCRCAYRTSFEPDKQSSLIGVRVVCQES